MGLTAEQWTRINDATTVLRDMGCAVCVTTVDDVESAAEEEGYSITSEQAEVWLSENRKWLEGGMAQYSNQTIEDAASDRSLTKKED